MPAPTVRPVCCVPGTLKWTTVPYTFGDDRSFTLSPDWTRLSSKARSEEEEEDPPWDDEEDDEEEEEEDAAAVDEDDDEEDEEEDPPLVLAVLTNMEPKRVWSFSFPMTRSNVSSWSYLSWHALSHFLYLVGEKERKTMRKTMRKTVREDGEADGE